MVRSAKSRVQRSYAPLSRALKIKLTALVAVLLIADAAFFYYYFAIHKTKTLPRPIPITQNADNANDADFDIYQPVLEVFRYKTPSKSDKFGKSFDYSGAVNGNLGAVPLTKRARSGILVDLDTHKVLWAKEAKKAVPIASMTKMMTCLLLFERMERDPNVTLETWIPVTAAASRVGESSVYLRENETFQLEDYLKAIIIKSANDAAFAVGEYVGGGSMENFLQMMNTRAHELGMDGALYISPHGLPNAKRQECLGSAEGMAVLAERLIEYPMYFDYATSKGGKIRQMVYGNTNRKLLAVEGVDGLKTGFTNRAGSCVTVSCLRAGRRMILVLTGMPSSADRTTCATQLLNWGYRR